MKTQFYFLALFVFSILLSCKSVEKLVDQGRYDDAIILATKKLSGKKNKKTKHIKALEKAFAKVNDYDLDQIERLKMRNYDARWDEVYNYLVKIDRRQRTVEPLLPIISKDGYEGYFELLDTAPLLAEAADEASEYRYISGLRKLQEARDTGDKFAAQHAYNELNGISRYFRKYKDSELLLEESRRLGTFHVLIRWDEHYDQYPLDILKRTERRSPFWTRLHTYESEDIIYDAITTIFIDNIDISPQYEVVNNFIENKEVERWVDAIDKNGNVVQDSSGNVVQVKQVDRYSAFITDITRSKNALINGRMVTIEMVSGREMQSELINHEIIFQSDGCTFTGDREALPDGVIKRLDHDLLPFPPDYQMIEEGLLNINDQFIRLLNRIDFSSEYGQILVAKN